MKDSISTIIPTVDQWSKFVNEHPNGNVFQTPEYKEILSETKNYDSIFITISRKNKLVGILLGAIQSEGNGLLGKATARCIIMGGPLVSDKVYLREILNKYRTEIARRVIYTQFRNLWNWSDEEKAIFKKAGHAYHEHLNFIHDLNTSAYEHLMKMHKGRRKNIRRAEKIPLEFSEVTERTEVEKCLLLISKTYSRLNLPFPHESFFRVSIAILMNKNWLKIFAVKYKDKLIAVRLVLTYNGLLYDWYAGSDDQHLDKYPNDFLPWKIIEWGIVNKYHHFDFGGAGKPNEKYGVRIHKSKFGGDQVEYGRYIFHHKPIMFFVGRKALKYWKRLNKC